MIQAFYMSKPEKDTPYRELVLEYDDSIGWHVLHLGGTKWGRESRNPPLDEVLVKDFEEGKVVYDKMFAELCDSGWRPYTPYETWD
jgi:hypothetical protein